MTKIPDNIDFNFRRDRSLDPHIPRQVNREVSTEAKKIDQEILDSTYDTFRRSSDKANIILDHAKKVAEKYSIPVDKRSIEIMKAVTRQDNSDGSLIPFSLFERCIDILEGQATKVDYDVIDTRVIADPNATERIIRSKIDNRVGDDDELLALLAVGGEIATLYLMHLIGGIWRGPEHIAAAPKQGSGVGAVVVEQISPVTEGLREAALGMATAQVVIGVNQLLASLLFTEGSQSTKSSLNIDGVLSEAKQIALPPLVEKIKASIGLNDYKIILRYCFKYISETNDKGYDFWLAYYAARKSRYSIARSLNSAPAFSIKEQTKKASFNSDNPSQNINSVLRPPKSYLPSNNVSLVGSISLELQNIINNNIITPTGKFVCLQDYKASTIENGLNIAAQVLDTRLSREVLCCLTRFLGHLDLSLLKNIRSILSIFLNSQAQLMSINIERLLPSLLNWVKETVVGLIYELVQNILDHIFSSVVEFISDIETDLGVLAECPLILSLISGILEALDYILQDLEQIVANYIEDISNIGELLIGLDSLEESKQSLIFYTYKKRNIKTLLSLIDRVLSLIEEGVEICDDEEVNDRLTNKPSQKLITFNQIIDEFNDPNEYLGISDEIKDKYFKDAIEIRLPDNSVIPAYTVGEVRLSELSRSEGKCYRDVMGQLIQESLKNFNSRER